jgi:hypothetical protein
VKFTRTTEYALRVLAFMSRTPREPRSSSDLHRGLGIPKKYVQRLLTALAKHMILAGLAGSLLLIGFLAFFFNIVMSLGLRGVLGIFLPAETDTKELVPTAG